MRHAFDSQNELGRLCDEVIYQNDLAIRLVAADLGPTETQIPVEVTHGSFTKTYRLDSDDVHPFKAEMRSRPQQTAVVGVNFL